MNIVFASHCVDRHTIHARLW